LLLPLLLLLLQALFSLPPLLAMVELLCCGLSCGKLAALLLPTAAAEEMVLTAIGDRLVVSAPSGGATAAAAATKLRPAGIDACWL
jgi:hypothetical protein